MNTSKVAAFSFGIIAILLLLWAMSERSKRVANEDQLKGYIIEEIRANNKKHPLVVSQMITLKTYSIQQLSDIRDGKMDLPPVV